MVVVTGATGNIGSKLSELLLSRGEKVRAVGRNAGRLQGLAAKGAEPAVGDMADAGFLQRAFGGADAVFAMIPPNHHAEDFREYQNRIGESTASAIRRSGVKHVVNLSSQGAHLPDRTGPIKGLYDQEQRLNGLQGVTVLHLRPTYFMENLLMNIDLIRRMGVMGSAVRGDIRFAMIATKDIARYAADQLMKRDRSGTSIHDLLGQRDVSLSEAASIIGAKLGRPDLRYVTFPYEDAEKGMVSAGLSPDVSRLFLEMSMALNEGLFAVGVPRTRENTTQTSIETFAEFFAQVFNS